MNVICTHLTEAQGVRVRSVRLLKIDGGTKHGSYVNWDQTQHIASRWEVHGYDWEIRFYPRYFVSDDDMALELVFLSEASGNHVTANLSGRLLDPRGNYRPSAEKFGPTRTFQRPSDSSGKFPIITRYVAQSSGYLNHDGRVDIECTVTVFKDDPMPSSNLQTDLGELLRSGCGADVTFIVSGESLAAHKNVMAARSPVFMAEFFGQMKETTSKCIEIKEMEAAVFKAMLGFIYTDTVPELDDTAVASHLLVAADRYGLDKLKLMCERRLALAVDADTVVTTLILAEQQGCSQLKAKCIEFFVGASPEVLCAILATEGFKSLEAGSPLLMELFKAVHAGMIKK